MSGDDGELLGAGGLCCVRDGRTLFEDLSFGLGAGDLLYLQGVNGAGKTSLLRMLCGLLPARAGEVRWRGRALGVDVERSEFYRQLCFIGHSPGVKLDLSARENLHFIQAIAGHGAVADAAVMDALDAVGLYGFEELPVRSLSAGQRRRVALARLWLSDAAVWLLDEPLTALDADAIDAVGERLQTHAGRGGCALFSSHQPLDLPAQRALRLG